MGLRADSAHPQRVSGSARTDNRRAESARNPIALHINFGDDSALNTLRRTQWTAASSPTARLGHPGDVHSGLLKPISFFPWLHNGPIGPKVSYPDKKSRLKEIQAAAS